MSEYKVKFYVNSKIGESDVFQYVKKLDIKERTKVDNHGKILKKGRPHNALEDAKLTAECFSRIVYGKNLFSEYNQFKMPLHLEGEN